MLTAVILLAATAATPTPAATQTPAPVTATTNGQTRTLADVARERKLGKKGVQGGTLSVSGAPVSGASDPQGGPAEAKPAAGADAATSDAQARLARAIRDGTWVEQNIHYNEDIKERARREWDAAAESCRATPGCTPVYRENAQINGVKPLRTGNEEARDLQKKRGADVDTPGR